jgi:pSer/pThr/pTyr-binding forkhead associated (FHA) protein
MAMPLDEIEQRLETLIETHLLKYLPGPLWQDKLAQRLTEALKANLSTQKLDHELPAKFILVVHPSMLNQWQKDQRLLDGLTKILRLATSEAGLRFEVAPTLVLDSDPQVPIEDLQVQIADQPQVAETQNVNSADDGAQDDSLTNKTAFLIVGGTRVHSIQQVVTNIGRRLDNHVVVDDPRVSRYHAQVRYVRGRFIIFDLNSTGGTYVNGQRISQSVLYPGDVISLAGLPIIFGQDNPPQNMASSGDTAPMSPTASERSTAVLKTIPTKDIEKKK